MKKIMIDMDDVITEGGFLHLINSYLKTDYKQEDFNEYYMQDIVPNKEEFFRYFLENNQYDYCNLKKDAKEVLKELNMYYEIYITTSYLIKEVPNECGIILLQKFNYLKKELPFINPYQYIFTSNKSIINTDIKIDDKISNLENAKRKLLFTAYHNKNIKNKYLIENNIERVDEWKDVKKLLKK